MRGVENVDDDVLAVGVTKPAPNVSPEGRCVGPVPLSGGPLLARVLFQAES
jgi:hypothetical protein